MAYLHPAVRYTEELRASAEALREMGPDEIMSSDDPLTLVRNLHAALNSLKETWPGISVLAGFEDPFEEETVFSGNIRRGFDLVVDGMHDASDSI